MCSDIGDIQYFHVASITQNVKVDKAKTCKRCYKLTIENVLFYKGFMLIMGHLKCNYHSHFYLSVTLSQPYPIGWTNNNGLGLAFYKSCVIIYFPSNNRVLSVI